LFLFVLATALHANAQLTFSSAIDLALQNSLKVKSAQQDVKKAIAALAITKDIFIPSVVTGGGVGTAYGITLNVPTIFTVNAQSLVYSAQQRFYIRAARSDLRSAQLELDDARAQATEDTVITYLSMDHAQKTVAAVGEQFDFATRLVSIVEDRVNGKLDSDLELLKSRRTAIQLKLQKLHAEDDVSSLRDHLSQLTGRPADSISILPETIPALPSLSADASLHPAFAKSPGLQSAEESAKSKRDRAKADSAYTWRPEISFGAQYGRVSPIENVGNFYNLHGNFNTASIGVEIKLPLLDKVRRAAAAESIADAVRSENELLGLRFDEDQGRKKLLRSLPELATSAQLAELEQKIAETELNSALVQMKQNSGGPVITPKEAMNAHIQERQKYLDLLDSKLQLAKAQISLLRQTGELVKWLQSIQPSPQNEP
jgi:outer membrane protein TolC